jgi:hypothetical protein
MCIDPYVIDLCEANDNVNIKATKKMGLFWIQPFNSINHITLKLSFKLLNYFQIIQKMQLKRRSK